MPALAASSHIRDARDDRPPAEFEASLPGCKLVCPKFGPITATVSPDQAERGMSKSGILVVVALLCVAAGSALWASADHPVWSISVVGLKGKASGTFTLELTDEKADTCMSGDWKKARVVQSSFQPLTKRLEAKDYFPTYEADGEVLTIQLNSPGLCDAYELLSGKFSGREGRGDYSSEGLFGGTALGTFTAKRLWGACAGVRSASALPCRLSPQPVPELKRAQEGC